MIYPYSSIKNGDFPEANWPISSVAWPWLWRPPAAPAPFPAPIRRAWRRAPRGAPRQPGAEERRNAPAAAEERYARGPTWWREAKQLRETNGVT